MYEKSCYKSSTSKYEKSNSNILIFPRYCAYLLICCIFYLKNDYTVHNALTIYKYLKTNHGSEQREWNDGIILKEKLDMYINNADIQ